MFTKSRSATTVMKANYSAIGVMTDAMNLQMLTTQIYYQFRPYPPPVPPNKKINVDEIRLVLGHGGKFHAIGQSELQAMDEMWMAIEKKLGTRGYVPPLKNQAEYQYTLRDGSL